MNGRVNTRGERSCTVGDRIVESIGHGADLNTVSRMLGHSAVKITLDVYGHVIPGMQKEALKSLDEPF